MLIVWYDCIPQQNLMCNMCLKKLSSHIERVFPWTNKKALAQNCIDVGVLPRRANINILNVLKKAFMKHENIT